MTTDPAFLALLQLADGLFPAGGFAHSFGLETYVQEGRVDDAAGLPAVVVPPPPGGGGAGGALAGGRPAPSHPPPPARGGAGRDAPAPAASLRAPRPGPRLPTAGA